MNVAISILGLAFLILIHEAGHFFTAVGLKMRPRKFYVGFPPAIAKVRRRGIEYGVGAIPLGGYVKIPGMHRPAPGDVEHHFERALQEAPELAAPLEVEKGSLAANDWDAAAEALPALERATSRAQLSERARAGVERGLSDLRDGLSSDAYWRAAPWKRVLVIFAGPATNLLFALIVFTILFTSGGGSATSRIDRVLEGSPAAEMGLRAGDRIVAVNGRSVDAAEISDSVNASRGRPIVVRAQRDGRTVELGPQRPERIEGRYRLGFVLAGEPLSPPAAGKEAVVVTWLITKEIGKSLRNLVNEEGRDQISSPVGIVEGSSTAARQGSKTYLWVLGLISLSLALLNLLPLLPLDGGHIFFSVLEWVRGRAVSRELYERFSAVGIAVVLMLFFIGLTNDVDRLGE